MLLEEDGRVDGAVERRIGSGEIELQVRDAGDAEVELRPLRIILAQTPKLVLDIAAETGFRSPSSFSRAFRRRYGVTPRAIRKA